MSLSRVKLLSDRLMHCYSYLFLIVVNQRKRSWWISTHFNSVTGKDFMLLSCAKNLKLTKRELQSSEHKGNLDHFKLMLCYIMVLMTENSLTVENTCTHTHTHTFHVTKWQKILLSCEWASTPVLITACAHSLTRDHRLGWLVCCVQLWCL